MANSGATTVDLMRFGRWKSFNVAKGYIEQSVKFKRDLAGRISTYSSNNIIQNKKLKENSEKNKVVNIYNNKGTITINF